MNKINSAYHPHKRVQCFPLGPSMTKQAMAEEANINIIMARYEKTGLVNHVNQYGGQYADMPNQSDFHEAMNLVTSAQQMFADLPAGVRDKFKNDPGEFLDFMSDEENLPEMVEMGLVGPEELPEADPSTPGVLTPETPASPQGGDPATE